jgi:hypothetical protein
MPVSPETSISAAPSTSTSMVQFPFPPPPLMVARRESTDARTGDESRATVAATKKV